MNTDKPTGMVTFLPAGGSGDEAGGKDFPSQIGGNPIIQEQLTEVADITQCLSAEDNRLMEIAKDESRAGEERFDAAKKIENEDARNEILSSIAMSRGVAGELFWGHKIYHSDESIQCRINVALAITNDTKCKDTLCALAINGLLPPDGCIQALLKTNDLDLYDDTLSIMARDFKRKVDRVFFADNIHDLKKRILVLKDITKDNKEVNKSITIGAISSIQDIFKENRASEDIKKLVFDTFLNIAKDSSIFWECRLEAAKCIEDNDKLQKAFSSIVTDPILEIGISDDPDVQEECYIKARKATVKSIKEELIRDNIIRDIIQYWGNTNCERFDLKNFKFFHDLASGEGLKKELVSNIVNNSNLNLDFRQDVVVMVIRNQDKRNNSLSWMTFQALNVQEYVTLETIRATINLARLMTPDSITIAQKRGFINDQRDCLTKKKKWILKERKEISNEKQLINSDSLKNEDFTKKRESLLKREKLLEKIEKGLVVEEILLDREENSLNIREEHELELRDLALQDIASKWKMNENESIHEHIKLFKILYQLVKSEDAKRVIIRSILRNNEHNKAFHDAVQEVIIEKGDEQLLPTRGDTKSARNT